MTSKHIQIGIAVLLALALLRVGWSYHQRSQPVPAPKQQVTYSSNLDDYVRPHKLYSWDLKSAKKDLAGKTVWISAGNALAYYPYSAGQTSLRAKAGLLAPLEKIEIRDVVLQRAPAALHPGQIAVVKYEILAVFHRSGEPGEYAFSIGSAVGDSYNFTVNQEIFIDDPHDLYKHWPVEVWTAIDHHEVKNGMSELQAGFALGTNANITSGDYGNRTIEYANAGKPVAVTFANNKAVQIVPGRAL
ncbi:MAG TPA: hypothetical protein VKT33_13030 [Candidatus Angelobacter sp.]|nr:hypothetical protein [Candidatus Angelobacter sp.]